MDGWTAPAGQAPQLTELSADGGRSWLRSLLAATVSLLLAALAWWLASGVEVLSPAAHRAAFVVVLAAGLWVSEAIAAFAVGILILGLQVLLLGDLWSQDGSSSTGWESIVAVLGHPLIWLFLGGFVLAAGMAQSGADRWWARQLIGRMGNRPSAVLLGVMLTTFLLSCLMSNTATVAMMLAILAPLLAAFPRGDRYATGLALGLAVAANLGGMGSLIGTPPNAIAVGNLSQLDGQLAISFVGWIGLGLPVGAALLLLGWRWIAWRYPSSRESLPMEVVFGEPLAQGGGPRARQKRLLRLWFVQLTLAVTVGLWLSQPWHGTPTAAIALLPIVLLTASGTLDAKSMRGLNYDLLFLLAGGLALGEMLTDTGLSGWLVAQVEWLPWSPLAMIGLLSMLTVLLSNLMSNTATATILIPVGISLVPDQAQLAAMSIALCSSTAMCLPVATPTNALVYGSGRVSTREFLLIGLIMGLVAPWIAITWLSWWL